MYNTKNVVEQITLDEILKRTTEYDIYKRYIGKSFKVGHIFNSPLRTDSNPSFGIFKCSKSGDLLFKDHSTNEVGNCIKFVQLKFSLNYKQALELIWADITNSKLIISTEGRKVNEKSHSKKVITIKTKYFTKTDLDYWEQYHIDKELLNEYNVYPIECFWVDDIKSTFTYTKQYPMYAYRIFNSFKIYRPTSETKKDKWRTNCTRYDIQGWEQLPESGELLVITKSLKDIMVLRRFELPSVSPHSEVSLLPESVLNQLKMRFKRIVVFYDNDEAGMNGAKELADKYDLEMVYIPQHYVDIYNVKDISDHIKEFGIDKTQELINELL